MNSFLLLTIALLLIVNALVLMRFLQQQKESTVPAAEPYEVLQPVLIICGDCSGEGGKARKTLLGPNNRCEACGGDNYVLASTFGVRFYTPAKAPELQPSMKQPLVYADYCYNGPVN